MGVHTRAACPAQARQGSCPGGSKTFRMNWNKPAGWWKWGGERALSRAHSMCGMNAWKILNGTRKAGERGSVLDHEQLCQPC